MTTKTYSLKELQTKYTFTESLETIKGLLKGEWSKLIIGVVAVLINSGSTIITPYLISLALDEYIIKGNLAGLNWVLTGLLVLYLITMVVSYLQTRLVGQVSQRVLFRLRQDLFAKLQSLPVRFFQQNTAGDIIARINNDTDKLNNFLSGGIFQFIASLFSFVGIGIFIFFLNWQLSIVVWIAVIIVGVVSQIITPMVRDTNIKSLAVNGDMTTFLDENLNNYKALVVFDKSGYLRDAFSEMNESNYRTTMKAQILNGFFNPLYSFASNAAQIMVLGFGLYFLAQGNLSVGLLVGFISYTQKFYDPLRTLGNIWGTVQEASAAWSRIRALLKID